MKLHTSTPCCKQAASFTCEALVPVEQYDKKCHDCGTRWVVTRTRRTMRNAFAMDVLEWEAEVV